MLNELAGIIHDANKEKGFYDESTEVFNFLFLNNAPDNIVKAVRNAFLGQRLALIISEVSECLESNRKGKDFASVCPPGNVNLLKDEFKHLKDQDFKDVFSATVKDTEEDEIADSIIRLLDLCASKGIDIDFHVEQKLRFNGLREPKHGKNY